MKGKKVLKRKVKDREMKSKLDKKIKSKQGRKQHNTRYGNLGCVDCGDINDY